MSASDQEEHRSKTRRGNRTTHSTARQHRRNSGSERHSARRGHSRRIMPDESPTMSGGRKTRVRKGPDLTIDTAEANKENGKHKVDTRETDASTPASIDGARTPAGIRGSRDLRSPGVQRTPRVGEQPIPDFITQTDRYGNATTPRSSEALQQARQEHPSGPEPHLHVSSDGSLAEDFDEIDPCETLLDSFRLMCCCLLPEDGHGTSVRHQESAADLAGYETDPVDDNDSNIKLLGKHHPDDFGKKCLVLDLDETLVHSSFRAVPGADFVIPVQIEDVVHFVYVAKRPGVDDFLVEMAKHYEIVVYTASLNKYADPLLDLLDPNRVIRARLFRESCVHYEGNYVKDLSLLHRDLSQAIIIDNSPASYIFHPENAIDCSSFIDDPSDRELDQIGAFLTGIKNVKDVRGVAPLWREWPNVELDLLSEEEDEDLEQ